MPTAPTRRFPQPLLAFGNPEDVRETDPDAAETTMIALTRGVLFSIQQFIGFGGLVDAAALSTVASQTSSIQLAAVNEARRGLFIFNTDANPLFVKYGTTAATNSFTVKIPNDGYWEMPAPIYHGVLHGIWSGDGTGSAFITEL
jgi:hypothetical protein